MGFEELDTAMRMRELIASIVKEELDQLRPTDKFGFVQSVNLFDGTAYVILDGDTEAIKVRYPPGLRPASTQEAPDTVDSSSNPNRVRITGSPGNYWITEILSGTRSDLNVRLSAPAILGGQFGVTVVRRTFTFQTGMPSVAGNTWFICRLENTASFAGVATGHARISIRHTFFTSGNKIYEVPIKNNATNGEWTKLVPAYSTGTWAGNDFDIEAMVDTTGVSLRVRATYISSGWQPGGFDIIADLDGEYWTAPSGPDATETVLASAPEPTTVYGSGNSVEASASTWRSPEASFPSRLNQVLRGGGIVQVDDTTVYWSQRFIGIGAGKSSLAKAGHFNIGPCVGGVTIPVFADSFISSVVTVSGGVPLADWHSLYYDPPYGTTEFFDETRLRVVSYSGANFTVPEHWIFIAARHGEWPYRVQFADGREMSPWNAMSAWGTNMQSYGGSFDFAYRWYNGLVVLKGVAQATGSVASNSVLFTMPSLHRPDHTAIFSQIWQGGSAVRVDIASDGTVRNNGQALTVNQWISMDGITFVPAS